MSKLLLVDSYGLCFRSFFAMKDSPLINNNGENVSVLAGFFSMLSGIIDETKCTHILIAADSKTKTFRHDMFTDYKANRPKTPEDLHRQINTLLDIISAFKLPLFSENGFEADDIIASSSAKFYKDAYITIVSSDKDLLQLVDDKKNISQIRPANGSKLEYYNEKKVVEKYGLPASKLHLYLSLLGDSSDNVPGVDGIGEKTSVSILQDSSSIDEIYAKLDSLKPQIRKKLEEQRDNFELSYKLVALKDDLKLPFEIDDLSISKVDIKSGIDLLKENGIKVASGRFERTLKKLVASQAVEDEPSLF